MADWRAQRGPATFRGVPFFTDTGERTGGRQTVTHEYPLSEADPYTEDLGRRGRKFTVAGYVIGNDYVAARDRLLTALEVPGSGELVHPYYGTRRVAVETYRVRETRERGGMAEVSIEFVETAAKPAQPSTSVSPSAAATASAATAQSAAGAEFLAAYSAISTLQASASTAIRGVTRKLDSVVGQVALEGQALADLNRQITNLSDTASGLADAPEDLLSGLVNVFDSLGEALVTSVDPSGTLLKLIDFDPGTRPPDTTPSREQEQANFDAVQNLVKRLALVAASAAIVGQVFTSYDDALRSRSAICDALDEHLEESSDDSFAAFTQLRADLVNAVPGSDSDLPRLQEHTPFASVPSLVLAHRLYGNLDREEDLIRRNGVKNPGFIPGGTVLEVLGD